MSILYIILILSNTHFLSLSFLFIKGQIIENIPTNHLLRRSVYPKQCNLKNLIFLTLIIIELSEVWNS